MLYDRWFFEVHFNLLQTNSNIIKLIGILDKHNNMFQNKNGASSMYCLFIRKPKELDRVIVYKP